jgi:diguanylate cyclase (GGDEF)-like protein
MNTKTEKTLLPIKTLKIAYLSALCLLALLAVSAHFILKSQTIENEARMRLINHSLFLRMHTQRIALIGRNLISSGSNTERENMRKELLNEIRRMEVARKDFFKPSPALRVYGDASLLNQKIIRFLHQARLLVYSKEKDLNSSSTYLKFIRREASGNKLPADFDRVAVLFQVEGARSLQRLQRVESAIMWVQLLLLAATAVFIFRPMARRIHQEMVSLSDLNQSLEQEVQERIAIAHQRAEKLAESEKLASMDPLTDVLNRRGFESAFLRETRSSEQHGNALSAMIVDLDNFKSINDQFGYSVGDEVLKQTARAVKGSLRGNDYVGRIGGDEFVVLLPRTPVSSAAGIAEKIRHSIEGLAPSFASQAPGINISASIGLSDVSRSVMDLDKLLQVTHPVLYLSKKSGKNRVSMQSGFIMRPAAGLR